MKNASNALFDLSLERTALAHCLLDPWLLSRLVLEDFYEKAYGLIFTAMQDDILESGMTDLVSVNARRSGVPLYENVGGSVFLAETLALPWYLTPIDRVFELLRGFLIRRTATEHKISENTALRIVEEFAQKTRDLQDLLPKKSNTALEVLQDLQAHGEVVFPLGFADLDAMIRPQEGNVIIIGGRPGTGKSSLLLNLAINMANLERKCLFLALEMSSREVLPRALQVFYKQPWKAIKNESFILSQKLTDFLQVDDEARFLPEIESLIEVSEAPIIFVDYLQLIALPKSGENRVAELEEITRRLKLIAMRTKKVIIAASQLKRELDTANRRPVLGDLRGSGSLEQDADVVVFIYNENMKDDNDKLSLVARSLDGGKKTKDLVELIVAKNRSGPLGTVKLLWNPSLTLFSEEGQVSFDTSLPF